jgi:hypothetical protein
MCEEVIGLETHGNYDMEHNDVSLIYNEKRRMMLLKKKSERM